MKAERKEITMYKTLKKFVFRALIVGNLLIVLLIDLVGNVDKLHPADYPLLANLGLGFPVILFANLVFFGCMGICPMAHDMVACSRFPDLLRSNTYLYAI